MFWKMVLPMILTLPLLTAGCSDDGSADPGDAAVDTVQDLADDALVVDVAVQDLPPPDASKEVTLQVYFSDLVTGSPVVGVKVCVQGDSSVPCVKSIGGPLVPASMVVPNDKDITLVATMSGYNSRTQPRRKQSSSVRYGLTMIPLTASATLATKIGAPVDLQLGNMRVVVGNHKYSKPSLGATVTISPAAGQGPLYADNTGWPDPTMTESGKRGLVWFFDLSAGDYVVSAKTTSGASCLVHEGFVGAAPTEAKVSVCKATTSALGFNCPE